MTAFTNEGIKSVIETIKNFSTNPIKKNVIKNFTSLFFFTVLLNMNLWGQVTQFPQVYYNGQGSSGANLYIHQSASYSSPNITNTPLLSTSSKIGAVSLVTNSGDQYFMNWVQVCLPNTNGSIYYGYIACDEFYARINEVNNYATVTATSLNIRTGAGTTFPNVTIGGVNATFGNNSIVALTGNSSNVSGVIWYQIHLTLNCSQLTGWVSSGTGSTLLNVNSNTTNYRNIGGRICTDAAACNFLGSVNGATINMSGIGSTFSSGGFYQYKLPINYSSTITCTYPGYNTSTPSSYPYTASTHNYTRNFVLSNTSSCTSPNATVNSPSGTSSVNMICTASGGSGGTILYKWYSGTLCSGTVLGTSSTLPVTTSGNYACKAYITGYETTCFSCSYGLATISTSCSSPTASVNNVSGASPVNMICTASGGSGGTILYKWYSGTSCSGTVLGTNSTLPVTTSGNYACKAYISGYETTCFSCSYGLATISTSCSSPTASVNSPSGTSSVNMICTASGGSGGTILYKWYSGTSCSGTVLGTSSTLPVTTSGNYSCNAYISGYETTCFSCANGLATITNTQPTISISSSVIPPWQRFGESYSGQITATTTPNNLSWHLEAYYGSQLIYTSQSTTSNSRSFNSSNFTQQAPLGYVVNYKAVLDANGAFIQVSPFTSIIKPKLDLETVVYFNDGTDADKISIPIHYDPTINYSNVSVQFTRVPKTAAIGMSSPLTDPPTILSYSAQFSVLPSGYCQIYHGNSPNLSTAYPGEFYYNIYNGTNLIETGRFSLVKIGRMNNAPNNNGGHVVVGIGGIYNVMEQSVNELVESDDDINSTNSFSILRYLAHNSNSNIWYIAQGNVNGVKRNGYDIGTALERIQAITNATEIDIVCHSKGGLDSRAFIENKSLGLDGTVKNFNTSNVASTLNKIIFFGTPHRGSNIGTTLAVFIAITPGVNWWYLYNNNQLPQGLYDLTTISNSIGIIHELNTGSWPSSIRYANLTGFVNTFNLSDVWVDVPSSENPINGCLQMYQNDTRYTYLYWPLAPPLLFALWPHTHLILHHNDFLSQSGKCTQSMSNISKILNFIQGNYSSLQSCIRHPFSFEVTPYGSLLPGTNISIKPLNDSIYQLIGLGDENGKILTDGFDTFSIGDSIKIEASGYEILDFAVDSAIVSTGKVNVGMFKSSISTNKIKYPSLKIVNQNPITANNSIALEVTGQNVLSYEINYPFNQDTVFVPLALSNNQFISQLDTGSNIIVVRLIGQSDTAKLSKEVFYFPGNLMNNFTYNVSITADATSIATKVYVNNQFIKQINTFSDIIPLLIGQNTFKFTKFGYIDSLVKVDSTSAINISLKLFPHSYSSLTDSNIVNFPAHGKIQYHKNVTLLDSTIQSIVSIKQYDDNFSGMGLIPKSRKFEMRHLNSNWSGIRFAAILDQIENLSEDSVYLMRVYDNTSYTKIPFDIGGTIAGYDSTVQKLSYNFITFNNGTAAKEALAIMKKQAPIINSISSLNVNENNTLRIALSQFFSDPDSIHNDMNFQLGSYSSQLNIQIVNDSVLIIPAACWNGNGTFTLKAQHDGLWRSVSGSVNVIAAPNPTITNAGATTFCQGSNVSLTASSGVSYLWSNNQATQTITVTQSGNYTVAVTDIHNCTRTSQPATVTVLPLPTAAITASGATTFCQGNSVTLTASAASSYLWSNGATTQSNTVSSAGNYFVTITNANGCSATSPITTVTVNPLPVAAITPGSATTFCQGNSVTLTASAASSYLWSNGVTTQSTTVSNTGNYFVTVTNGNGCSATSSITTVTVNPLPTATITPGGPTTFCQGNSLTLTASVASSYLWSNGATTQSNTVSTSGNYSVTVTNGNGCSATSPVTNVIVNPTVVPAITIQQTSCNGNTVSFNSIVTGGGSAPTYSWSITGSTQTGTGPSFTIANATMGMQVQCTVASNAICRNPPQVTSIPLTIAIPHVSISGNLSFCQNSNTTLTANGAATYQWSNGLNTPSVIISNPGTYSVVGQSITGCSDTKSVQVTMLPIPTINLNSNVLIYQGGRVILGGSPSASGLLPLSYKWTPGTGLNSDTIANPIASPHLNTTYTLKVTDKNGCTNAKSIDVSVAGFYVFPNPTNDIVNIYGSVIENGKYVIRVTNHLGQTVLHEEVQINSNNMNKQISINKLASGIYFLSIDGMEPQAIFKISKL